MCLIKNIKKIKIKNKLKTCLKNHILLVLPIVNCDRSCEKPFQRSLKITPTLSPLFNCSFSFRSYSKASIAHSDFS